MSDVVKSYDGDQYGKVMNELSDLASYANNDEMRAVAYAVIREDGRVEMKAYVDDADKSELRAAVIALSAALAET